MGVAHAAITPSGGDNAATQTPNFFRDAQGLALEVCTTVGADPAEPVCEPPADGHIGLYFAAEATAGPLSASWGVEAVEDEEAPGGEPLVTNGYRYDIQGARANTLYRIKSPWGTTRCRTDAAGEARCLRETNGDFNTVRNGHVTTFLRAIGRNGGALIGNPELASRVTGSPTGFNRVSLIGPRQTWSTNRFGLIGQKRADTAMSALNRRSLQLGNGRQSGVVSKSVRYSSIGTANARPTVRKGGQNAGAFRVTDNCASQAPGTACNITVTFRPGRYANSVKRAFLVVDDNGLAAPRRVSLKGIGS